MIFTRPKREMYSYFYLFGVILIGFVIYFLIRDKLFDAPSSELPSELFHAPIQPSHPAMASIELRQAPIYPPRTVASSGPHPPSQPSDEVRVYGEPEPKDPYHEHQESSDIPEKLRNPENSFRPPPLNDQHSLAVQSGVASQHTQVASDNPQRYQQELIHGGGEFMPGIFANDTYNDNSYSAF